jgi:hypothetical protein
MKDVGSAKVMVVEKKTLAMLGKERLSGWKIKGKREFVLPERLNANLNGFFKATGGLVITRGCLKLLTEIE